MTPLPPEYLFIPPDFWFFADGDGAGGPHLRQSHLILVEGDGCGSSDTLGFGIDGEGWDVSHTRESYMCCRYDSWPELQGLPKLQERPAVLRVGLEAFEGYLILESHAECDSEWEGDGFGGDFGDGRTYGVLWHIPDSKGDGYGVPFPVPEP